MELAKHDSTATRPVGFGIIGLGYGEGRAKLIKETAGAQLVAVSTRSEARASAAAEKLGVPAYTDYREMLERDDIDVVGIYTPSGQHRDIAINVAEAGKHMVITKPIEITVDRVDAILAACEQAGVKVATEYIFRYRLPQYRLYSVIQAGVFGTLVLGEFSYKCYRDQAYYESDNGWRGTWEVDGGGAIMNQTIHYVDQMLWMMGEAESVAARAGTYSHQIETEDTAIAQVSFKNGSMGVLVGTTTFHNDRKPHRYGSDVRRIEVNGVAGSATILDDEFTMWKVTGGSQEPPEVAPTASNVFEDMVAWINDDGLASPTLARGRDARQAVALVTALYESARTGKTVDVP